MAGRRPGDREPKHEADTYLLSYPKAGRTWLRVLIGKALVERYGVPAERLLDTAVLTGRAGLPRATFYHDGSAMIDGHTWRDLPSDKSAYRDKRVVLIGRDVRDILVSSYFQATRRIDAFDGPISAFVRDDRFGARKVVEFYRHWWNARSVPAAFLFVRYEAMHDDAAAVLARVLAFLGARDVAPATIAGAADFARFERMRASEASDSFPSHMMRTPAGADPEAFKLRKGVVGGFRDYLSADDVAYVDACEAEHGCEFTRPAVR